MIALASHIFVNVSDSMQQGIDCNCVIGCVLWEYVVPECRACQTEKVVILSCSQKMAEMKTGINVATRNENVTMCTRMFRTMRNRLCNVLLIKVFLTARNIIILLL